MAVGSVQDVMLAAVAVSSMQDGQSGPQAAGSDPAQESAVPASSIMRSINVNLEFQYHKEVNVMSVRMLDKKTGEVLREVPPEAMVEHMIKVHDWIGAFLDKTA